MNQVLGIVRHHNFEANLVLFLIEQHALVDPVQAVRFGRGPIMRTDSQMHVGKTRLQFADGVQRGVIIGISANEEVIVVVVDGGHVVLHHPGDHLVFVPQRYKDSDVFLQARFTWFRLRFAARPGPQTNGVQSQVVQPADENGQGRRRETSRDPGVRVGPPGCKNGYQ